MNTGPYYRSNNRSNISISMLHLIVIALFSQLPQHSYAQTLAESLAIENPTTIVITGTRMPIRSSAYSPAPIDIFATEAFENQSGGELPDLLNTLIPSFYVRATGDAASLVRPASLRGLPSDATLVLTNGKRRHRSSVISFIGSGLSDGAQGPDLSVIPSSAIKRLEVLRDGAAAQYGSDAIGGLFNIVLKNHTDGGSLDLKSAETYEGDGAARQIAGNVGIPFTSSGFFNVSVEARQADPTDRSTQRADAAALTEEGNTQVPNPAQPWGSAEIIKDVKSFLNAGIDLNSRTQWYGFGNYASRQVETGFSFRNPNRRSGVFAQALNLTGAAPDVNGNAIPFYVDPFNQTVSRSEIVDANGAIRSDIDQQGWTRRYDRLVADLTADGSGNCPQTDDNNNGGLDVRDDAGLAAIQSNPNCAVFNERFSGGFTPRFGSNLTDYAFVTGFQGSSYTGID